MAIDLLSGVQIVGSNILADKAYGTKGINNYITGQNAVYAISPKENYTDPWLCDFHTCRLRNLVECFFNKTESFCRVVTRYDKLAVSFVAFIHLAYICILLK